MASGKIVQNIKKTSWIPKMKRLYLWLLRSKRSFGQTEKKSTPIMTIWVREANVEMQVIRCVGGREWGTEEIQFMPALWRFERGKGAWEPQSTVVRKERGEFLTPPSHYWALGFPSWIIYQKPREFRHKLSFFCTPLQNVATNWYTTLPLG